MVPLTRPWRSRNTSRSWHKTSTSALPMPITSRSWAPGSATPRLLLVEREILPDQQVEAPPGGVRKGGGTRDHGVLEQVLTLARALGADRGDDATEHVLRGRDVLEQVRDDRLDAHRRMRLVPDVVVSGQRERGVAELGLAGQLRLRHVRHADHVHAPRAVHARLGACRELWSLDAHVGAAAVHAAARRPRGLVQHVAELTADRIGHPDVGDDALAEEGRHAPLREVDELAGNHQVERPDVLLHAADGGHRHDALDTERLQAPDVGAEVQLRRRQAVAATMARQEDHGASLELAGAELVGGIAEGRAHAAPADIGEAFELVEPAAADDPDRATPHATISPRRSAPTRTRATRRISASGPSKTTSTPCPVRPTRPPVARSRVSSTSAS